MLEKKGEMGYGARDMDTVVAIHVMVSQSHYQRQCRSKRDPHLMFAIH
jgi:hypothetical protein